jgi:hypothetical protein
MGKLSFFDDVLRWASFGIGKEMIGSPLYVFWKNSAGDCVVSRREATGYVQPLASNNQAEKITDLDSSVSSKANGANLKCTMTRPLSMSPSLDKDFIWAIGAGVVDVNDAKSNFGKHTIQGKLIANKKDGFLVHVSDASISTFSIFAVLATLLVLH